MTIEQAERAAEVAYGIGSLKPKKKHICDFISMVEEKIKQGDTETHTMLGVDVPWDVALKIVKVILEHLTETEESLQSDLAAL